MVSKRDEKVLTRLSDLILEAKVFGMFRHDTECEDDIKAGETDDLNEAIQRMVEMLDINPNVKITIKNAKLYWI